MVNDKGQGSIPVLCDMGAWAAFYLVALTVMLSVLDSARSAALSALASAFSAFSALDAARLALAFLSAFGLLSAASALASASSFFASAPAFSALASWARAEVANRPAISAATILRMVASSFGLRSESGRGGRI